MKQESMQAESFSSKSEFYNYAIRLIERDINHLSIQADMRKARSKALDEFLGDLSEILYQYKN